VPGYEKGAVEGGPPLIEVDRVEPAEEDAAGGRDVNRDGVVDGADGEAAAAISDAARSASEKSERRELPATGGPALVPGAAIALLLALVAGLYARRNLL
jgi:hypothetical protein